MAAPIGFTATPTTPSTHSLIPISYRRKFMMEYIRASGYAPYIGGGTKGMYMPFHMMTENKKEGETTRVPLLTKLLNGGVAQNDTLVGNEEQLGQYAFNAKIENRRHAVATTEWEEHKTFVKVVEELKPALKNWSTEQFKNSISDGLAMVRSTLPGTRDEVFGTIKDVVQAGATQLKQVATAGTLNSWDSSNFDRVLYGLPANNRRLAGNFAGSLGAMNATDLAGSAMLLRMKYLAQHAQPAIRPISTGEQGREHFVLFCDSDTFQQFHDDEKIWKINTDSRAREGSGVDKNPLFQDGDLLFRNVIIREIHDMPAIEIGAHGNTRKIGRLHLCGAQALSCNWGEEPVFTKRMEDDYQHIKGVGIREKRSVQKIQFLLQAGTSANPYGLGGTQAVPTAVDRTIDFGTVTGFCAL